MDTVAEIGQFRNDGPDTMLEGAIKIGPKLKGMRLNVLGILDLDGNGMTDPKLVAIYKKLYGRNNLYRSIGARRRELVLMGLVRDSGRREINKRSGVSNIVWEVVKK